MNSCEIEIAIAKHFNTRVNLIVPNIYWGLGFDYELDLIIVTQSHYAWEVEIKTSISDLKAEKTELVQLLNGRDAQRSHAAIYTALLDLLLYPFFSEAEVAARFDLEDEAQWLPELKYRISLTEDQQLIDYVDQLEQSETDIFVVVDYIVNHIRTTLS